MSVIYTYTYSTVYEMHILLGYTQSNLKFPSSCNLKNGTIVS